MKSYDNNIRVTDVSEQERTCGRK